MDISLTMQVLPAANGAGRTSAAGRDGNRLPTGGNASPPAAVRTSIESAVAQINSYLGNSQRELSFSIDRASGHTVIKVVNPNSGEVIRQIPSEEVLKMAAALARHSFHTFDALA